MKGYEKKIAAGLQGIFLLMVLAVLLFFILGEWLLPSEGVRVESWCQALESEWTRSLPDGSSVSVEVPGTCKADRLESVSIETRLPEELEEDTWLCIQSVWQDLEIFVDQVLRQRYSAGQSKIFGRNSASAYLFQKLTKEDAGKILRITSMTDSPYSGKLSTVYIGDRIGILNYLIAQHGINLALEAFLIVLSILCIFGSWVLRRFYHKEILLRYLAWGSLWISISLAAGCEMRQFLFPNISVASNLMYFSLLLIPFPFLVYMDGIQRQRYQSGYVLLELLAVINFLGCTSMQVLQQMDFMDLAAFMYGMLMISCLYVAFTMGLDFKRKNIRGYRLTAVGMLCMVLMAAGELWLTWRSLESCDGILICIGMIALLALSVIENVRKLFSLEREKQRAVLANESKGKFLANMSHEIRTPINTVIGMNEMILRENQDDTIQSYAENINHASKTLLSLVNDVLDFSKMESGSLELSCSPYYLSSLLNDTFHVLKVRAEQKNLIVKLNVDEDLPSVLVGDEVRIRKILQHLFSNSIKFTEKGSITFSTQGEWNDDGTFCLSFSVADTGIGIQKEDLGRLYDSFTKLEEDRNCTIQGSGLGLNITKRFVEQMQGDIRVHSVYGTGTLFTVRIPQVIVDPEPIGDLQRAYERELQEFEKPHAILQAPEACILSVDDNEMNLAVVRGLLKRTGIQLDTVTGGKECLLYTRRKKYDLIFMDHMMPEPDGIETFHMLRAEADNPNVNTKVVALTANAVAGSRQEYLKEGFDDYLSKPIVVEKLEQMLLKYLPEELVFFKEEETVKELEQTGVDQNLEETSKRQAFIDQAAGLPYCGNDKEMYQEILLAYYEQGQQYLRELKQLYQQQQWENYAIIAHAIKSTSLTIGAAGVSSQAKQQELAAKENRLQDLKEQWEKFCQDYTGALEEAAQILGIEAEPQEFETHILSDAADLVTQEELTKREQYLPEDIEIVDRLQTGNADNSKAPFDQEEYFEECQILLEHIRGYEMSEALVLIDKLLSMKHEQILEQVRSAVHDFDYDNAESCLQTWMEKQEVEQ